MSLLLLVFLVSFLGSIHCSVMCCPVQNLTKNPYRFQLGRLGGYLTAWLLIRSLSAALIEEFGTPIFQWISLLLISWILFEATRLMGWHSLHFKTPRWTQKIKGRHAAWLSGWGLSLRGCGWMWSFVIFAAAEGSWPWSLGRLMAFYLGTMIPFIASAKIPQAWALSPKGRGRWLFGFAALQLIFMLSDPLPGLHDFQRLMILGEGQKAPKPPICAPPL